MRTYSQALDYLASFINYERQRPAIYSAEMLNLDRMRALLRRLGDPHRSFSAIHIAGTKGKGSTSAMIESIVRTAGYRAGLYTSPHLHTFRERMRVNGELISPDDFAARVDDIEPHAAATEGITWFEIMTALAFSHFARSRVEVAVVEVGLGGRFDATNVLAPRVSVITSLSMDHMSWLGHTLEQIAFEKAGIIKPGVPVVSAPQPTEAMAVIERAAADRAAPLTVVGRDVIVERTAAALEGQQFRIDQGDVLHIPLLGSHQVMNAVVAVTAVQLCDQLACSRASVADGLQSVRWPGRFEVARREPPLVFDGAHNADSAGKLAETLGEVFPGQRWTLVFGASADKEIDKMLDALLPPAERVVVTRARNARAADLELIAELATERRPGVEVAATVREALTLALEGNGPVIVTGSLFVVAEARESWAERIGSPILERDD